MITVIFEVWPSKGFKQEYLDIASDLAGHLKKVKGFISIERFESLSDHGKILSLSFWTDEEAVKEWRNSMNHRNAQKRGREEVFLDYRLRVAHVLRDYDMHNRLSTPEDSRTYHNS